MSFKGEVVKQDGKWFLDTGNVLMAAGCHHTNGERACGGCYARLSNAIDDAMEQLNAAKGVGNHLSMPSNEDFRQRCINALDILFKTIEQRQAEKPL